MTKKHWLSIGIALVALLVLFCWAWLAGSLFVGLSKAPVSPGPLTLWDYWTAYGDNAKVARLLKISAALAGAPFLIGGLLVGRLFQKKRALYGEARFATQQEVEKAGMLSDKGMIVGKLGEKCVTYPGDSHAYVAAPTRGGKGVGIVIPNLLNWPDSVVVLDIKQENWDITAGFRRKHGHAVFLFNPAAADGRTHRWNPLTYISQEPGARIDDIQKIASMIWPDPANGGDPIWTASCRSLFLGIVLYLLETEAMPVTLGETMRQAMAAVPKKMKAMLAERADSARPLSPACVSALMDYLDTSDNTRTSIRKSFTSRLELWQNPMIDAATAADDFDLRELRSKRMSVYIGITPDNLERLAPIINLFFQQVVDLNTRQLPEQNKALKFKCLLLMDEFTAIGRLPILAKGISYIAGYNLRILAIFQSPAQVRDVYGREAAQTFFSNFACQVVFAPREFAVAKEISDELGTETVKAVSSGKSGRAFSSKSSSTNMSDHSRALLLPQEVKDIGQWSEILLVENIKPIQCEKIRYYAMPAFMDRLKSVSASLGATKGGVPTREEFNQAIRVGELGAPVPVIQPNVIRGDAGAAAVLAEINTDEDSGAGEATTRAFTADDVATMDTLNLSDFSCDFSKVEIPKGDLSSEQLDALAASFYETASAAD